MAVKASAQITLNKVIDIDAYYRYYLLQSSTATKPSKPTTYPPPSTWDDVEPTYTSGSTNSLYFVDCTVYCDGTFTYSDVSLSSSYEAAKEAYNKAVNAQGAADNALNTNNGLGVKWNYAAFSSANTGEAYLCARDPLTGALTDANGWVLWNGVKRTVTKGMINPNTMLPYNQTIYIVLRLSSATATTGTTYLVWYNSGWKYGAINAASSATVSSWTWADSTDIVLGSFVEPGNELAFVDCTLYTPCLTSQQVTSGNSAYLQAASAQNTANTAVTVANNLQGELDVALDVIVGTQTSATGSWTGVAKFASLSDGQQISYWLPYAGSGNATLNLTLSTGSTTGAINVYYGGTTRVTTHYPAGSVIKMTYRSGVSIAGSSTTYTGWWADANYDSGNTYDRTRYNQVIKCGTTAIAAGNIIVGKDGVYAHLKLGSSFDISYPILYAGSAISASGTGNNNYLVIAFNITTTQSITLTAYKPVYIKGKLAGTLFTPISTTPLTQTVPTSADGYHYMLLGNAYSTTSVYLLPEHPIFMYYNGAFKSFEQIAAEAAASIDNLEVGGRNLMTNSKEPKVWYCKYGSTTTGQTGTDTIAETVNGQALSSVYWAYNPDGCSGDFRFVNSPTATSGDVNYSYIPAIDTQVTFSVWVKATVAGSITLYVTNRNDGDMTSKSYTVAKDEWTRISLTKTFTSTADPAGVRVRLLLSTGMKLYVALAKLEKGNQATDWTPAPEDVDEKIDTNFEAVTTMITDQRSQIIAESTGIIMSALTDYVTAGDYVEFRQTVESQLSILSDSITMSFTTATEQINNVDADAQSQFEKLYKHISFSGENAISIGSGDNAITLTLDNENGIIFSKNGAAFGLWDGVDFHTGNIIIDLNQRAQFGNFAFVPRSDGSLSFLQVGG